MFVLEVTFFYCVSGARGALILLLFAIWLLILISLKVFATNRCGFFLSSLEIYHALPFWLVEISGQWPNLKHTQVVSYMFMLFLLLLPLSLSVFNFCQFNYNVSQCVLLGFYLQPFLTFGYV